MPTFYIDVSKQATDYVAASIKDLGGNPGQDTLIQDLEIDCGAQIEVDIAGDQVDTQADGYIVLNSNHPDAIEQIMATAEDNFLEFLDKLSSESEIAYNGLDIIRTIRQDAIDEAFGDL